MGVDLLRSCYTTSARLFRNSDVETPIRWFFCDPGAELLPFPSCINSRNWGDDRTNYPRGKRFPPAADVVPGEVLGAPRPWRNGSNFAFLPGEHWQGDPEEFLRGMLFREPRYLDTCFDLEAVADCAADGFVPEPHGCELPIPTDCVIAPCCMIGSIATEAPSTTTSGYLFGPTEEFDWNYLAQGWSRGLGITPAALLTVVFISNPDDPDFGLWKAQYSEDTITAIFESPPVDFPCDYPPTAFTVAVPVLSGWHFSGNIVITVRAAWSCSDAACVPCVADCAAEGALV
jgi:hypothetical protein